MRQLHNREKVWHFQIITMWISLPRSGWIYVKVNLWGLMMMVVMVMMVMLQLSLDPEHDNTNLKIGPKNTMEIAILNDDDPGETF